MALKVLVHVYFLSIAIVFRRFFGICMSVALTYASLSFQAFSFSRCVLHVAHFQFHRCARPLHAFAPLLVEHCLHDRFVTYGALCLMRYALIISPLRCMLNALRSTL
jgi:hypothetical protein